MNRSNRVSLSFLVLVSFLSIAACITSVPAAKAEEKTLYEGDSIYNHITIRDVDNERCMLFGRYREGRETCIKMEEPDVSVFEYTAIMFVGFLFQPDTKSVALLGLGGGYLPIVFRTHLAGVKLDVVEVDPKVVELAKKYFQFATSDTITLAVSDGRLYLKRNKALYDQIWVDTFNSDYIPAHMTTKEFLELAKSRLNPHGVVVQNVHNSNKLYDAHVTTFRSAFKHVFVFTGKRSASSIIVGADDPIVQPNQLLQQASRLGGDIGKIDLAEQAGKYTPDPEIRQVKVLTDDYAPANLWILRK